MAQSGVLERPRVQLMRGLVCTKTKPTSLPAAPRHPIPVSSPAGRRSPVGNSCVNLGYDRRALAEAAVSRYKRVIGDSLRSRTDRRRAVEVAIAVRALNRMLELGRPESVRVA